MKRLIEFMGWYGAVAIILAYALISFSYLQPQSIAYQLLNITGAVGIITISFYKRAYQPGILNLIWALVAFVSILKILY